ncbi:MAG: alpha-L-fucosidase [Spirochaetaceae bacterium]
MSVPNYLASYQDEYASSPHAANMAWFQQARFGMFIHFGLYSQLGRGEWALHNEAIPLDEYERLYDTFDPSGFDADFITDLALDAGMKYITITSCHHEGFSLWDNRFDRFNSVESAGRDLIRELATACDRKGLGFFTYYTYVHNWRHPYSITRDVVPAGRPDYPDVPQRYILTDEREWVHYWDYAHRVITDLLSLDVPLAGIWLDIIMAYYWRPDLVPVEETYSLIREQRPDLLLCFKQGATGTEDYASPESSFESLAPRLRGMGASDDSIRLADKVWAINRTKHNEICATLQKKGWGYLKGSDHYTPDEVRGRLAYANANNCNLLMNVAPLGDGSLQQIEIDTLREVGKRIREQGMPGPDSRRLSADGPLG